jgi:hypothetical protein
MKAFHKKIIGPGGVKCRCCNLGSVKETRVALNRRVRRANNMLDKNSI